MIMKIKTMFLLFWLIDITHEITFRQKRQGYNNPMITKGLFEGDMKGITNENVNDLISRSNTASLIAASPETNAKTGGAAVWDPFAVWPKGELYYEISDDFNQGEKTTIKNSFEEYHDKTCIKMIPRTNQNDYVKIRKLTGCWSNVGRQGGPQELSLGSGCVDKGVIIHEFMHALGFFHEQSRWDRDKYIEVRKENILLDQLGNFNKYDLIILKSLNTDYDYESIMHYRKDAFTRNGLPTIAPLKKVEIGDKSALSPIDALEIQRMYNCDNAKPITTSDPLEDYLAEAYCLSVSPPDKWVFAVPRQCDTTNTCDQICQKMLADPQTDKLPHKCVGSIHVYPGTYTGAVKAFKYDVYSCSKVFCEPNFCCCATG